MIQAVHPVLPSCHISIRSAAALALGLACAGCGEDGDGASTTASIAGRALVESDPNAAPEPEPAPALAPDAAVPDSRPLGPELGSFEFTYYWMASETGKAQREVQLYHRKKCKPVAKVSKSFAERLALEGTGRLRDGRTINVSRPCNCPYSPCFFVVSENQRWGVGVANRALSPFRSVAVDADMIPIGTMLYVPELDGLTMPGREPWGGFVHDGCVIADDRGGKVTGQQLDFYTANITYYRSLNKRHRLKLVTVYDGRGRCEKMGSRVVRINRNAI